MTNTKTANVGATLQQIAELTAAGCDIVRVAVPSQEVCDRLALRNEGVRTRAGFLLEFHHVCDRGELWVAAQLAVHLIEHFRDRIEVTVHPQSIVHSMVEFCDGATISQASPPDMRLPIALGLSAPERLNDVAQGCDWITKWLIHWCCSSLQSTGNPPTAFVQAARPIRRPLPLPGL